MIQVVEVYREIDAHIAAGVFGCKPKLKFMGHDYECGCSDEESPEGHNDPAHIHRCWSGALRLEEYSVNIAAAMKVVAKLMGNQYDYTFTLQQLTGRLAPGRCCAVFTECISGRQFEAFAPDAAAAICLAALKVIEAR